MHTSVYPTERRVQSHRTGAVIGAREQAPHEQYRMCTRETLCSRGRRVMLGSIYPQGGRALRCVQQPVRGRGIAKHPDAEAASA